MQQQWWNGSKITNVLVNCFQMWSMTSPGTGGFICAVEKLDQLLLPLASTTRFMLCLVPFRHLHSLSLSSPHAISVELHQEANHYSTELSLHGWLQSSNRNHSFSMQVKGEAQMCSKCHFRKLNSYSCFYFRFYFTLISTWFHCPLPVSMALYQKMDHWLYPLCMAGIFIAFHAGKSEVQMCSNS